MSTEEPLSKPAKKAQESPFANLLFNIILPVALLNFLSKRFGEHGPQIALLVALAFPIAYGAFDYIKKKEKNYISLLGIINILFTGGLALFHLEGFWFAVKEAAFPLVIGTFVYFSIYTKKPAIRFLAYNKSVMNIPLVEQKLEETNNQEKFNKHLKISTQLLALSFLISAILNYVLARRIFTPIDTALTNLEKSTLLNEQIAQMTWLSFIVIALPLTIFMFFILFHLINGIKKLTHLEAEDVFPALGKK